MTLLSCQQTAIRLIEKRLGYMDDESSEYNWLSLVQTTYKNAVLYSALLYNLTHNIKYAELGYQFAEKNRMMIILLSGRDKKIKHYMGVPDSIIEKEISIHNSILNLQNQLYQCDRDEINSHEKQVIIGKLARIQLENDRLKSYFKSNYNRYFDLKYNINVLSLHQIQKNLSNDQIILEYQLLENELIIMAISKEKVIFEIIADDGNKKESINKFYQCISENPSNKDPVNSFKEFAESSYCLYLWLIEPIRNKLGNKRLIIIPHNEISLVPFELLISEMPPPQNSANYKSLDYLIKKYPVSYGYSGTLLFDQTKPYRGKSAAFFIPDYSDPKNKYDRMQLFDLKGTKKEVKKIRALIGGDLFSGKKANETNFKLFAGDYKILHIASHASADYEVSTLSSINLSNR